MDAGPGARFPIDLSLLAASGLGCVIGPARPEGGERLDALPWLRSRKLRKFMGKQDELAVIAAGRAIAGAGLEGADLGERAGVYLAVGTIPFERSDIEPLARNSADGGRFSMRLFSTAAYDQVNPLLTFRCLPNMPAFHVSLNFGIRGPYFVTYPGVGQFYVALERAAGDLARGRVDLALVGAVADQRNFLVERHFRRIPAAAGLPLADAGAFLCFERAEEIARRGRRPRLELRALAVRYRPRDPMDSMPQHRETLMIGGAEVAQGGEGFLGAASLAAALERSLAGARGGESLRHQASTIDGFEVESEWRLS